MKILRHCIFTTVLLGLASTWLLAQNSTLDRYYAGEYSSVIEETSEAILSGDTAYNTFYLLALSQIQLGKTENAIETLSRAMKSYPDDVRISRMLAVQLFEAGKYPEAKKYFSNLVSKDSADVASWIKLAEIAAFKQDYYEAIHIHNYILSIDSTNMNSLVQLGDILSRQNDESTVDYYERAHLLYPNNQQVSYILGNWYIKAEQPEKTTSICKKVLEADSTNIRFHKLLGFAYYKFGITDSSMVHFKKAISLGDSTAFTFKYLGIDYYLRFAIPEAIQTLSLALDKDSLDAEVHFFLGASLAITTEKSRAMAHLERSLELMNPEPATLSRIYSEQGNIMRLELEYEEAYRLYNLAWESDTTNPLPIYYMASILDNNFHRSKEALVDYQLFIDKLDLMPSTANAKQQNPTIRTIVEERIIDLNEELFFLDEK